MSLYLGQMQRNIFFWQCQFFCIVKESGHLNCWILLRICGTIKCIFAYLYTMYSKNEKKKKIVSAIKDMEAFILLTLILFTIIICITMSELFPGSRFFQYEKRYIFFYCCSITVVPIFPLLKEGMYFFNETFKTICSEWPMDFIARVESNQSEELHSVWY